MTDRHGADINDRNRRQPSHRVTAFIARLRCRAGVVHRGESTHDRPISRPVYRLPDLVRGGSQLIVRAFDGVAGDCVDARGFGWVPIELGTGRVDL
jgi:hypothetical protein